MFLSETKFFNRKEQRFLIKGPGIEPHPDPCGLQYSHLYPSSLDTGVSLTIHGRLRSKEI